MVRLGCAGLIVMAFVFLFSPFAADADADPSDLSWEVFREINLARTNPKAYAGFVRKFRRSYHGKTFQISGSHVSVRTAEGVAAVDEAIAFLSSQKPQPPLVWSEGLARAAAELVEDEGPSGETGHTGAKSGDIQKRIERQGSWRGGIGENICYGPSNARLVVMELIIDDGVPDRGHRKNLFHRTFSTAGVSCGPHMVFSSMCVIDFAVRFTE